MALPAGSGGEDGDEWNVVMISQGGFLLGCICCYSDGIPTSSFALKRSVRQGCPLSPLMFILAFDVHSLHLQSAMVSQTIQSVTFARIGVRTLHNMFVDDLAAIIRALMKYICEFQRLLEWFGAYSGLHCVWEKTVASCIPAGPRPLALRHLPWKWEDDHSESPLLGVPTAQTIAQEKLEAGLVQKMDSRILKYKHSGSTQFRSHNYDR